MEISFAALLLSTLLSVAMATKPMNVLFLASDDMRPELGVYNGPDAPSHIHPKMHTPNIDGLAARSLLLKHAYVQQAICAPSRTSLLTGRRPDTTHVYDLMHYWRNVGGNFTTIPQYFKQHGYETVGMGKIFHPGSSSGGDDPMSWTLPYSHFGNGKWGTKYGRFSWYGINDTLLVDQPLSDMQIADNAVKMLKELGPTAQSGGKPFFIAAGFHRPHLPFTVPQSFLDLYPMEDVRMPPNPYAPIDMPEIAWTDYAELRHYDDQKQYFYLHGSINTSLPELNIRQLRRAYYAAISYTDHQIGKILTALKDLGLDNSTIVSFWGDHGWNLGEHGEWCKHTNFEISTHAPMMVRVPELTDDGVVTERLTEFVDLFPSLVEAAGLPKLPLCPEDSSNISACTEGVSFVPLMKDPDQQWKSAAFSQYPRMERIDSALRMGYTMRTEDYRYTEYPVFEYGTTYTPYWRYQDEVWPGGELYDHKADPDENWNHYADKSYADKKKVLQSKLQSGWRDALPPSYRT